MNRRSIGGVAAALATLAIHTTIAAQSAPAVGELVGTYRLVSFHAVVEDGTAIEPWGKNPPGYAVITPQRFIAVMTAADRKLPAGPAATPQELVASFLSQNGYSGTYRIDGNRLVTKVDASAYATWLGTNQVREFKLEGKHLHMSTLPGPLPWVPGKPGRMVTLWERVE
jgi:hypothetical protein